MLAATGHATVVAVGESLVRGSPAEHRFHHFHVAQRPDPLGALAEAIRHHDAVLLVPTSLEPALLIELLELVQRLESIPVLLALANGWTSEAVGIAIQRGVNTLLHAPVTAAELGSAAHHALRAAPRASANALRVGKLTLDLHRDLARWAETDIPLRRSQLDQLQRLMRAYPEPARFDELALRPGGTPVTRKAVRRAIAAVRAELRAAAGGGIVVEPVARVGYCLRLSEV
ncbi:hypothetical protein [Agrococcus beijingensis]|uniref:hypothetical protein n=1 Tax=Agrococcus beijingensis TaxID=3068634 RepID=UPI0027429643|nr:hypothetical protein [Agrococcus sp. REN33]